MARLKRRKPRSGGCAQICEDPAIGTEVDVQPGTVLVFNNRLVLHGRGALAPAAGNERDRQFKRIYGHWMETETNPDQDSVQINPFIQNGLERNDQQGPGGNDR